MNPTFKDLGPGGLITGSKKNTVRGNYASIVDKY